MTLSRRKMIGLIGGGAVLAATTGFGILASRKPQLAGLPWETAGQHTDPRHRALSYALLAPNPHNRQPWLADLTEPNMITLYADPSRLLPQTDPMNRQITIGLGCFLELMRMAADGELKQVIAQLEINAREASHPSIFVAGGRPLFMWIAGFAFAYSTIVQPVLTWVARVKGWPDPPDVNTDLLWVVVTGLLGIGGLRSIEKIKDKA